MTEQHIKGTGNIAISGVKDSSIDITQYIGKSAEYQTLIEELANLEGWLSCIPEQDLADRLRVSQKVDDQKKKIIAFKQDVLRLAETFRAIEINTERLTVAKKHFEKGEFSKAHAILNAERPQMEVEQTQLLNAQAQTGKQLETITRQLSDNASEFLILAQTTALNYDNPNRFQDTCTFYEKALKSHSSVENIAIYALFLQNNNEFLKAETLYKRILDEFRQTLGVDQQATILNNLANLHSNTGKLGEAEGEYGEALSIYRSLAEKHPEAYLTDVAMTLVNLSEFYTVGVSDRAKAIGLACEALTILKSMRERTSIATVLLEVAQSILQHWNYKE